MSGARDRLRAALGWPARRLLDPRARWTADLVDDQLGGHRGERPAVHDRLDVLEELQRRQLAALGAHDAAGRALPRSLEALDEPVAALVNWAAGPDGPAAQAGLWFNEPVPVRVGPGRAEVLLVNERIVEQPYVLAAVPSGASVLDVGGAESTLALALASRGHDVRVVDPRGYPLAHPGLSVSACALSALSLDERVDCAVALSAVEHFGLGHYAGSGAGDDRDALVALRSLVRPGGTLLLTVPFAADAGVEGFERVYDLASLDALLAGWEVVDRSAAWRLDRLTWMAGSLEAPRGDRGVALVTAVNR
ncbi:MAG: class I SAM-dependent methyltransferase [Solirubrobacteraceae bacterium MAG38_C4-C5]|nr:class I SAM-dependent methyltransferase [Candidatus Siliceabacter maunaloa]